jgi:mannose-6-phosphate isomerase
MACSDNVIRAGLTPKYIDVATLCSLLRYHCAPGESMKFKPTQESGTSLLYRPPVKDFAVARAEVSPDNADRAVLGPRDSASIVLIEAGGGQATVNDEKKSIKRGDVLFLKSGDTLVLQAEGETLRAFQAFC